MSCRELPAHMDVGYPCNDDAGDQVSGGSKRRVQAYLEIKSIIRYENYHKKTSDEEMQCYARKLEIIFQVVKNLCENYMLAAGCRISIDEAMICSRMRCPSRATLSVRPIKEEFMWLPPLQHANQCTLCRCMG